ncbi:MAG: hypothetical protein AAGN66_19480 [Acidobacteriota bacterium]
MFEKAMERARFCPGMAVLLPSMPLASRMDLKKSPWTTPSVERW